jgi:Cu/Ag efflux protein CusF
VLSGTIVGVDYGSASILVGTQRGVVPVAVTPTTSIFRGSGFASFSDLGRGARVEVDFTQIDGRLVAQIIRIR